MGDRVAVQQQIAASFGGASQFNLNMGDPTTAMGLELVGGVCLIIGLFTRFFAAALAIEMGIAFLVAHLPKGYAASGGGYEYVLLIGVVVAIPES